jgi:hypothetical protein
MYPRISLKLVADPWNQWVNMLSMLLRSLAQETDQSAFRMTPKQRKYRGYMAATITHSRACLASPKNIVTFLCHYSFPPMYETYYFLFISSSPFYTNTTITSSVPPPLLPVPPSSLPLIYYYYYY